MAPAPRVCAAPVELELCRDIAHQIHADGGRNRGVAHGVTHRTYPASM